MNRALVLLAFPIACAEGSVIDPYPTCPSVQVARGELAAKAAHFDDVAVRWHIPAGQDLLHNAILKEDLDTFDRTDPKDNTGLWTSAYTASQAFRYAATNDPVALANLKRVLRGHGDLMRMTGVPGLFARSYIDTRLPGFPTEAELAARYADCDLSKGHCKRWLRSTVPGFENHLFKNDTSKDEYSGHMFALAVAAELVDDAEVQQVARELASQAAHHLIDNDLEIRDIDGATTTFGRMSPISLTEYPGFNATLTLSWVRVAATLTGERELEEFYQTCMLHEPRERCAKPHLATEESFLGHLAAMGLDLDCQTNWNNHNMAQLAMFPLIRYEPNPRVKARYREVLENGMWAPDDPRPMRDQGNSLFTFFFEVNRDPKTPRPDKELDEAICTLKRYPAEKYRRDVDTSKTFVEVCRDRRDHPLTAPGVIISIEERQVDDFIWTLPPYRIETEPGNRRDLQAPEDYLLAYWLGRYFGIIAADL